MDGIQNSRTLPAPTDLNLFQAAPEVLQQFRMLPLSLAESKDLAKDSPFIRACIPQPILDIYTK